MCMHIMFHGPPVCTAARADDEDDDDTRVGVDFRRPGGIAIAGINHSSNHHGPGVGRYR